MANKQTALLSVEQTELQLILIDSSCYAWMQSTEENNFGPKNKAVTSELTVKELNW